MLFIEKILAFTPSIVLPDRPCLSPFLFWTIPTITIIEIIHILFNPLIVLFAFGVFIYYGKRVSHSQNPQKTQQANSRTMQFLVLYISISITIVVLTALGIFPKYGTSCSY